MVYNFNQPYEFISNSSLPQNVPNAQTKSPGATNPWEKFYSSINADKIKENTKELPKKAVENAQDTFWGSILKSYFGISDNPKKSLISAALTFATFIGLALLGNSKLSVHKMPELGLNIEDILSKNKISSGISNFFKNGAKLVSSKLKIKDSKTVNNIVETFKNRPAKAKWNFMGYGNGIVGIFSNTPVDIMRKSLGKLSKEDAVKALAKLVGSANISDEKGNIVSSTAENFYKLILGDGLSYDGKRFTNREICKQFMNAIAKNFNCIGTDGKTDKRAVYNILCQLKEGNISGQNVDEFTDVLMNGDPISSWLPVNIINFAVSGVSKLFHKQCKNIGRGNLGDSLIKYGVASGELANSKIGSLVQKSILYPTESISNFVNDKSTFGLFLCGNLMNMYNDVQDAPKEERKGTIAHCLLAPMVSFIVATPFAYGLTYGLATFGNLSKAKDSATIFTKILKLGGNIFNIGLNKKGRLGGFTGIFGGVMRFYLIQKLFSDIVTKPTDKIITKVFGKQYNAFEQEPETTVPTQPNALQNQNFAPSPLLQDYLNSLKH